MTHPATAAILRFFEYDHLSMERSRDVSQGFHDLARDLIDDLGDSPHGAEVTAGLRKLLEAKDCFVRATLP
jgi:hypothetical protein